MRRFPTTRTTLVAALAAPLLVIASCGDPEATRSSDDTARTTDTTAPVASDLALIALDDGGVAVVPLGSRTPRWSTEHAAAALDGSAVVRATTNGDTTSVDELDVITGAVENTWEVEGAHVPVLVTNDADLVVLRATDPSVPGTRLTIYDTARGATAATLTLDGEFEPEAFSEDRQTLFALQHYSGTNGAYDVVNIDVATGDIEPNLERDGELNSKMFGTDPQPVLSSDGSILATLYRNHTEDGHAAAFVHVLDLVHGRSHCANLLHPFGAGAPSDDFLARSGPYDVVVTHTDDAGVATTAAVINVDAMHNPHPQTPIAITVTSDATDVPTMPAGLDEIPGFTHLIATVSA